MVPISGGSVVHWTGRHSVTNVRRFCGNSWGDGGDCIFELIKSSSSCGGSLAPGLNVETRIKGTIQFTFIRGEVLKSSKTLTV